MRRDKIKVLIIAIIILTFITLLFLFGLKVYNESFKNFKLNGYIIANKNNYKTDRYYFNKDQKYKKTANKNVVFKTTNKTSVSVDDNSFVHYSNNSISTLKKAAILDLDNINDTTIKYYNLYEGSVLNKVNDKYSFTNLGKKISLGNIVIKISKEKYLVAAPVLKLNIGDEQKEIKDSYIEITFFDGNIVKIENQEESYKNIQSNILIEIGDITINLNNKEISKSGEVKLNLEQITIDSDDNIDISEKENQDVEEATVNSTENKTSNTDNNRNAIDIPNVEKDTIESYDTSEIIINNKKYKDPVFTIEKLDVGINSIDSLITVDDPDNLLKGNIYINVYNSETSEKIYEYKQGNEISNISVKLNTLNYNTNYILVVSADYEKGDITYNKDFIQKTFTTSDLGISITKNYITKDSISLNFENGTYSSVDSFTLKLCDDKNECTSNDVDINNSSELVFNGLKENTKYSVSIDRVTTSASGISTTLEAEFDKYTYSTLKKTPSIEKIDVSINKKNNIFTLTPVGVIDPDGAIKSYQYEIYEVVAGELQSTPTKKIEKKDNKSFDVEVSSSGVLNTLKRNTEYKCYLTVVYNDNTKDIYMEPLYTTLYMGGNEYPSVDFEETGNGITFESVNGFIKVNDVSHAIRSNSLIVEYSSRSSSIGGRVVYSDFTPGDTSINIPINITGLKSNESYSFKVISNNIELGDINSTISNNETDQYVELKNFNITTKTPNKIKVNVNQNDSLGNFFSLNMKFDDKEILELNTLSILKLSFSQQPDFSENNNNELVEIEYKDSNNNIYESNISSCFISNTNCNDIPLNESFNLTSSSLGLDRFDFNGNIFMKIEGVDYAGNVIDFSIVNDGVNTNTNIFKINTIDSLKPPTNTADSLMIESITKQNAVALDNKVYSDRMLDDTVVGFAVYPRSYFNSGNSYRNYKVKMYYDLYKTTYNETKKKYECIKDDSLLIKKYEYGLVDNPKDAKQKMYFDDVQYKRGNYYCINWYAELIDPNDSSNVIRYGFDNFYTSKVFVADLQKPIINMYLENSNNATTYWKYKYDDFDNSLKNIVFDNLNRVEIEKNSVIENDNYGKQLEVALIPGAKTDISYDYYSNSNTLKNELLMQYTFDGEKNYNWNEILKVKLDNEEGNVKVYFDNIDNVDKIISDVENFSLTFSNNDISKKFKFNEFSTIKIDNKFYRGVVIDLLDLVKVGLTNKDVKVNLNIKYDSGISGYGLLNEDTEIDLKAYKNGLNTGYYKYNNNLEYNQFLMNNSFIPLANYSVLNDTISFKLKYNDTVFNNTFSVSNGCVGIENDTCIYPSKIVSANSQLSTIRFDSAPIVVKLIDDDIGVYTSELSFDTYGIEKISSDRIKITVLKDGVDITNSLSVSADNNKLIISGLTNNTDYQVNIKYKDDSNNYISVKCIDREQTEVNNFSFTTPETIKVTDFELKYNGGNSYSEHYFNATYTLNSIQDIDYIQYWLCDNNGDNCIKLNLNNTETNKKSNFTAKDNTDEFSAYYLGNDGNKKGIDMSGRYTLKITPKYNDNVTITSIPSYFEIGTIEQLKLPVTDFTISTIIDNNTRYNRMHFFISDIDRVVVDDKCIFTYYDNSIPVYEEEQNILSEDIVFNISSGSDRIVAQKNHKYSFTVKCDVDMLNNGISRTVTYSSKDIVLNNSNVDLGNIEIHRSQNSDTKFELRFYDSINLNELSTMNYSIYVKSGNHSYTKKGYPIADKLVFVPSGNYYKLELPYDTLIVSDATYLFQMSFKDINNETVDYNTIKWNS